MNVQTSVQPIVQPITELNTPADLKELKSTLTGMDILSRDEAIAWAKVYTVLDNKDVKAAIKKKYNALLNSTIEGDKLELDGGLTVSKVFREQKTLSQATERYEELLEEVDQLNKKLKYAKDMLKAEEGAPGMEFISKKDFSYVKIA